MTLAKPSPRRLMASAEEAQKHLHEFKVRFQDLGCEEIRLDRAWLMLGLDISAATKRHENEVLGMSHHEWMIEIFGESWQRANRAAFAAGELSPTIPEKELRLITEGNAVQLARLSKKKRMTPKWISLAQTTKTKKFKMAVDTELVNEGKGLLVQTWIPIAVAFHLDAVPKELMETISGAMQNAARIREVSLSDTQGKVDALEEIVSSYLLSSQDAQVVKGE